MKGALTFYGMSDTIVCSFTTDFLMFLQLDERRETMSKSHSVKFEKVHNIRVVLKEGGVELPKKIRHVVEKHWESLIHSGKRYWNGPMFFLKRIDRCDRECPVLSVAETDYAHYLAIVHRKIPEKYTRCFMYVSVLLKTSDDFFIFGEMAEHTVSPGKVLCAGGGIERRYLFPDGSFDIRGNAGGEFKEELYLDIEDSDEVECFRPLFLKTGGDGNIGIFLRRKRDFLMKRFFINIFGDGAESVRRNFGVWSVCRRRERVSENF